MHELFYFCRCKITAVYNLCLNAKTILLSFQIKIEPGKNKLTLLDIIRT